MTILQHSFFAQTTLIVARALLGQRLVRELDDQRLSGLIVETEAYIGPNDSASHASKGRTPRTEVMFGPPGRTYVYFVYGMHHMLNIVTEAEGFPAAVLIRAIEPVEGVAVMQVNRHTLTPTTCPRQGVSQKEREMLTNGPARLCQAFQIDRSLNNWDVSLGEKLWLEPGDSIPDAAVATGPRIGVNYAHPTDRAAPWRFWIRDSRFVSK